MRPNNRYRRFELKEYWNSERFFRSICLLAPCIICIIAFELCLAIFILLFNNTGSNDYLYLWLNCTWYSLFSSFSSASLFAVFLPSSGSQITLLPSFNERFLSSLAMIMMMMGTTHDTGTKCIHHYFLLPFFWKAAVGTASAGKHSTIFLSV